MPDKFWDLDNRNRMRHRLEMIIKLNDGSRAKHSLLVHNQATLVYRVNVTLYQQKVRARFNGQKTRTRHVNAKGVVEMLDGSPSCCFKLFKGALRLVV